MVAMKNNKHIRRKIYIKKTDESNSTLPPYY